MNAYSLAAAFMLGVGAGASSCLALSGGLMLTSAASFNRRHPSAGAFSRMRPVSLFVIGRLLSYALLGGSLVAVSSFLHPSPTVNGLLILLAAAYMLAAGLDLLGAAPAWLKGLMPQMPKAITRRILDAEGNERPIMPFVLGAATFFLP